MGRKLHFTEKKPVSSPFHQSIGKVPACLDRQRRSVSNVRMMGLFGLGVPELLIILIAAVVVIGPTKVVNTAGNLAGKAKKELDGLPEELKRIPEEFQKGVEEGESNARARNAKPMKLTPKEDDAKKESEASSS